VDFRLPWRDSPWWPGLTVATTTPDACAALSTEDEEDFHRSASEDPATPIDGLGYEAVVGESEGSVEVVARRGNVVVEVSFTSYENRVDRSPESFADRRATTIAVARHAVGLVDLR
jgi:hypothetical protein